MNDPVVQISSGAVRGRTAAGVSIFKGIPYAESPFGARRLLAPVPAGPWEGVREADRFGPQPPQSPLFKGMPAWNAERGLDCLTVNVWTPDPGGSGLPVMVWFYGGAFRSGSADLADYDGSRLAAAGVVVVTLNYRVGLEGFGAVAGAPVNRALLDQAAALGWVQANIAAFGGDPGNVTIFGESAGASAVACLMVMPSARGLFRRAIAQSMPGTFYTPELSERIGKSIARRLGTAWTVEALAEQHPERLVQASDAFTNEELSVDHDVWGAIAHAPTAFSPVVDGDVLPDTPWNALAAGVSSDIDLIVGFTRDEFRLFTTLSGAGAQLTDGRFTTAAQVLAPAEAEAVYRGEFPQADAAERYTILLSDWLFRMPSAHLADAHARGGGRTYAYELTWEAPGFGGALGACHGLDVPLTFGALDTVFAKLLVGDRPEDRAKAEELSAGLRASWTGFAAKGDPGWHEYDPDRALTQVYGTEITEVADPEAVSRRLWSEHRFSPIG